MDLLQWMGAVRMRVQTADKKQNNNPQVIQIICITDILTSNCGFQLKYLSVIHNNTSYSEKVVSLWIIDEKKQQIELKKVVIMFCFLHTSFCFWRC